MPKPARKPKQTGTEVVVITPEAEVLPPDEMVSFVSLEAGRKKPKPGRHPNSLKALKSTQFKKGQSGNPAGYSTLLAEVRGLAQEASVPAIKKLVKIMNRRNVDDRVAIVAADKILERAWGPPKEAPPVPTRSRIDLSRLPQKKLDTLKALLAEAVTAEAEAQDAA